MIEPPFDNEIKCLCCLTDCCNTGKFYIPGCDIKRNLDNAKVGYKKEYT